MGIIDQITGKEIVVNRLQLSAESEGMNLLLEITCEEKEYRLFFEKVTSFVTSFQGYPFQIFGFEVLDHHSDGWQSEVQYEVRDYEEDSLAFYCKEITVQEIV